jgi:putative oxidoreductase
MPLLVSKKDKTMTPLINLHNTVFDLVQKLAGDWLLPTLARFAFAAVLLGYFWNSAITKLGDGIFGFLSPSFGGYTQIWPRAVEAAGYDLSAMSWFQWLVVVGGTVAEFTLPLLILLGLFTRLAAVAMIGFVFVQSLTDIIGHHADPTTIGAWFDRIHDSQILDQRLFWVTILITLVVKGAGPLSLDRMFSGKAQSTA